MFTAADALKKILATKPTTLMVLLDEDGDEFVTFTEAEYSKAKKVQYLHLPDTKVIRAEDLETVDQPEGIDYDDLLIPATDVKKITMVQIAGRLTTAEEFKRIKRKATFRANLRTEFGYEVEFTKDGINVGCQRYSWAEWQKTGKNIINRYFSYSGDRDSVQSLLTLILENKERILAKLATKPAVKKAPVKKVAAKKAVKKVAKKTVKRK
jgi:hypothetical protein